MRDICQKHIEEIAGKGNGSGGLKGQFIDFDNTTFDNVDTTTFTNSSNTKCGFINFMIHIPQAQNNASVTVRVYANNELIQQSIATWERSFLFSYYANTTEIKIVVDTSDSTYNKQVTWESSTYWPNTLCANIRGLY